MNRNIKAVTTGTIILFLNLTLAACEDKHGSPTVSMSFSLAPEQSVDECFTQAETAEDEDYESALRKCYELEERLHKEAQEQTTEDEMIDEETDKVEPLGEEPFGDTTNN